MRNEEDDGSQLRVVSSTSYAAQGHEKDMINQLFGAGPASRKPLRDAGQSSNSYRPLANGRRGEEESDYEEGNDNDDVALEGNDNEDEEGDDDGGEGLGHEHHPFYLPQGITELDEDELEELLYSSEDDDSDGGAGGLEGGGGVLPHSAKYQALSLRASRGHEQQQYGGGGPHNYQGRGGAEQRGQRTEERLVEQVSVPLLQQHGGSAHQYYNYFEGDAESGDNSHTSLPWAPGLPQHISEAEDVMYRSAGSLFSHDFADILQSRAKTSASTGDIPLYVASPSERIVDNGRINGGFAMQKRHLDMEMQHYHRLQLDREWERERDNQREREREWEWELERQRERESERLRRNSYDTPSLSSATWSRAVGGDAHSGVHRQQQQGAHHGGAGGAQYYSSGSIGGGSDEGTLAARRLAEKAVNKSTPSLPVSSPLAMAAAPKSAPLPQDRHPATAVVASQPAPGLLPLQQQQQQQHSGSTVKLTPPIYNTPSSQHQKKTVWKQRSPSAPHQAPGGTAPNAGSAQPQANTQDSGAVSSGGAVQLQMHSGQLPSPHMNPQRSPIRSGMAAPSAGGHQNLHQPPMNMLPPGVRALSPPRSPTRGAGGRAPPNPSNSNLPQEYVSRPRPRQSSITAGSGGSGNSNNSSGGGGSNNSQRALFPSLPQGMQPQQGLFPQPPPAAGGRNMGAPKQAYFAGSSTPNLPTYMPPPQAGRRGMGVSQGIPVAIAPFYPPFAFASSASMPSLPAMHGGMPNFAKPINFPPQPSILGAKYHAPGGGAMRPPNFPPPAPYPGHSHHHQQQQQSSRDHRKEQQQQQQQQQKEREREREKEKEQQQKERETQKRKPKGMWKVKNRQPQPAAANDDASTAAITAAGGSAGTVSASVSTSVSTSASTESATATTTAAASTAGSASSNSAQQQQKSSEDDGKGQAKSNPATTGKNGSESDAPNARPGGGRRDGNDDQDQSGAGQSPGGQPQQQQLHQSSGGGGGSGAGQQQQQTSGGNGSASTRSQAAQQQDAASGDSEDRSFAQPPPSKLLVAAQSRRAGGSHHEQQQQLATSVDESTDADEVNGFDDGGDLKLDSSVWAANANRHQPQHHPAHLKKGKAGDELNGRGRKMTGGGKKQQPAKKPARKAGRNQSFSSFARSERNAQGPSVCERFGPLLLELGAASLSTVVSTAVSVVAFAWRLHRDALWALLLSYQVPLGLLYIYVLPSLAAWLALYTEWAPAVLWYAYVAWFVCSQPHSLALRAGGPSASGVGVGAVSLGTLDAGAVGARVLVAFLFLLEGVYQPAAIMAWNAGDRVVLGLALLSTKTQAFLYKRCFVSLMAAMALNHYIGRNWTTTGHEAACLVVQWFTLVVGLANHYACSTTPKRRTSSLGKRLRGQIAAAFAKPGQPPLDATKR